jgi:hypothetical protein
MRVVRGRSGHRVEDEDLEDMTPKIVMTASRGHFLDYSLTQVERHEIS